jgi:hypothetical protein
MGRMKIDVYIQVTVKTLTRIEYAETIFDEDEVIHYRPFEYLTSIFENCIEDGKEYVWEVLDLKEHAIFHGTAEWANGQPKFEEHTFCRLMKKERKEGAVGKHYYFLFDRGDGHEQSGPNGGKTVDSIVRGLPWAFKNNAGSERPRMLTRPDDEVCDEM